MMFSSPECITWFAVGVTESVAIVTVNFMVVIVFMRNRNLRKRTMYLVMNLVVADMLVGEFSILQLCNMLRARQCDFVKLTLNSWFKYGTVAFIFHFFPLTSLTNIAVISLERMHATFRPFRHRVVKEWVYKVIIAVVWILVAAVSTAIVTIQFRLAWFYHMHLWQSYNCFCLFIICVSYASVVVKMYRGAHPQYHGVARRERKLTVTLLIVTFVSLLMWLPYVIGSLVYFTTDSFRTLSWLKTTRLNYALIVLFYANSLVNPILYAIRMPEFKTALLSLFRRQQRQIAVVPLHPL